MAGPGALGHRRAGDYRLLSVTAAASEPPASSAARQTGAASANALRDLTCACLAVRLQQYLTTMCAGMQVIDARDPLTYRSNDLEQYAQDIAQHKGSLLLLNKADLLSAELRTAWADYFDERGVSYVFWSAKAAADALKQDTGASPKHVLFSQHQYNYHFAQASPLSSCVWRGASVPVQP